MELLWDNKKNKWLKENRSISFEAIAVAMDSNKILDILEHPNKDKYPDQILILMNINDYVYVVPAVIQGDGYFLKTIFPSRKYTELYLSNKKDG
jgi:uncharacterized DUF497 family protein